MKCGKRRHATLVWLLVLHSVNTLKKEAPKARLTYQGREVQWSGQWSWAKGQKTKWSWAKGQKTKWSWAKGQKEPPNEKLLWGVFCPSLGACVFGASSSPSVLGFSKSPPSQIFLEIINSQNLTSFLKKIKIKIHTIFLFIHGFK